MKGLSLRVRRPSTSARRRRRERTTAAAIAAPHKRKEEKQTKKMEMKYWSSNKNQQTNKPTTEPTDRHATVRDVLNDYRVLLFFVTGFHHGIPKHFIREYDDIKREPT